MNWYSALWYWYNIVIFGPFAVMLLIRCLKNDPYDKWMGSMPSYKIDTCFRVLLFPASLYYLMDSIYLVLQWELMSWCNLSYLIHHLFTLSGAYETLIVPYYPWFMIAPFTVHSLLITFPSQKLLNYVYLVAILSAFYNLNRKPWSVQYLYRRALHTGYILLVIPIHMLWWFDCNNDMKNVI